MMWPLISPNVYLSFHELQY